jgi:hypothetical protein
MPTRILCALSVLCLLVSGCDSKSETKSDAKAKTEEPAKAKTDAEAKPEPEAKPDEVDPSKPSADWAKEALTKVEDEVDGIKFSIELPANLKREVKASDGTFPGYVTWNGPNPFMDPSFTVQIDAFPPADLEAAARKVETHPKPAEVTRKEELPDGGMLLSYIETSKEFVNVRAWRTSPSSKKVVRVTVQLRSTGEIPDLDALRAWMEQVVSSFAVQ